MMFVKNISKNDLILKPTVMPNALDKSWTSKQTETTNQPLQQVGQQTYRLNNLLLYLYINILEVIRVKKN